MFRKILRDSIGATIFIFVFLWLVSKIEFESDLFNPVSKTFGDFQLTDLVFSHFKENADYDDNVILVNIGDLPRGGIAKLINRLSPHKPKVIGIDAFFRAPKAHDPEGDSMLADAFSRVENLVLVSKVNKINEKTGIFDTLEKSHPIFSKYAHSGMSNMISEGYDKFKSCREFSPYEKYKIARYEEVEKDGKKERVEVVRDTIEPAFGAKLAYYLNPDAFKNMIKRGNSTEIINYSGNFLTSGDVSPNAKIVYTALDIADIFDEEGDLSFIKDKIILMGYLGPSFNKVTWEDKFFTPLNVNYIGKANPDMYGVVVHANIVTMILRGDYINVVPDYLEFIICFVLIFINIMLFSYLYFRFELWYDGLSLLLALVEVFLLMGLIIWIFITFKYKIDFTIAIVALFLIGNLLEIYYGLIRTAYMKLENYILSLLFQKKRQVYES